MPKKKKPQSTFELAMQDPKRKAGFDKEYEKFVISELLLEFMEKEKISVRKLSRLSGIAPSVIQAVRREGRENISLHSLCSIFSNLGCDILIKKGAKTYPIAA